VVKFTSGYIPHRMDRLAIEQWAASKLKQQAPERLIAKLKQEIAETETCLSSLKGLPRTVRVERAIANATEHRKWLWLRVLEVRRRKPLPKTKRSKQIVPGSRSRIRTGLLAREAQVAGKKP
jgi:hypothetical protein